MPFSFEVFDKLFLKSVNNRNLYAAFGGTWCCAAFNIFSISIPYSFGWVGYHHMGDNSHELAVLNNGAAAHECGQLGTTVFNKKFKSQKRK